MNMKVSEEMSAERLDEEAGEALEGPMIGVRRLRMVSAPEALGKKVGVGKFVERSEGAMPIKITRKHRGGVGAEPQRVVEGAVVARTEGPKLTRVPTSY